MKPTGDNILVTFDDFEYLTESGLKLHIPERYLIQESDEEGVADAYGVTTDRRKINPQTVSVVKGNKHIPDGSKCFVHYGAYEVCNWVSEGLAMLRSSMVFFTLDPIKPLPGNYLGEQVIVEGEKTASGIYITPYAEKKEACHVKMLHVPDDSSVISEGDTVITVDAHQYELKYRKKTFIKLKESEIIGVVKDDVIPLGDCLLVEYIEDDAELTERIAENDRRKESRDIALKFNLKLTTIDFEPVKEPKTVKAKLISFSSNGRSVVEKEGKLYPGKPSVSEVMDSMGIKPGDTLLIHRNVGCVIPDGRWIINLETVLGVV